MWNRISGYSSSRSGSSKSGASGSRSNTYVPPYQAAGNAPPYSLSERELEQLRSKAGIVPGRAASPEARQKFFELVDRYSRCQAAKGYRSIADEQAARARQPTEEIDTQSRVDKWYHQAASNPSLTQSLLDDYDKF